jgi:hypothetical protein
MTLREYSLTRPSLTLPYNGSGQGRVRVMAMSNASEMQPVICTGVIGESAEEPAKTEMEGLPRLGS